MRKILLHYALATCCLFACMPAIAQTGVDIKRLDSGLAALSQTGQFNGTVLYAENGKLLYKKAFGINDIYTNKPLTTASSFNLASVSKQFMAMGILQLLEAGKLQLDDAVVKYIPELPYTTVTIRQLLTHTSGIPEYFDVFERYRGTLDTLDNEGMIKMFATYKPAPDFAPGSQWNYCNTNYVLLASVIERITKTIIHDYLQAHIFGPLGMKDTYVYNDLMHTVPANHVLGFEEVNGTKKLADLTHLDGVVGDGNVYSSVDDLLLWDQALYTTKLVKKETLALGFEPVKLNDGTTHAYGFAWGINKPGEYYAHTGSWMGFKNLICRDVKNKRTLVVLSSGTVPVARLFAKAWFEGEKYNLQPTTIFTNVKVVDGTGTNTRNANVRIQGNKIIAVGNLAPYPGEETVDGGGNVLAPGFIDSHSHLGGSFGAHPDALAAVSQGVTTIVAGQDGDGDPIDTIKAHILKTPIAINLATYTGQTALRAQVMGENNLSRICTPAELKKMKALLKVEMEKGSLGLSTGLEYAGAYFSNKDEVIELAKVAGAAHGRYISHIRSEDVAFDDAIDEIITIGREANLPVQVSHIKIALKDSWGTANQLLAKLDAARQAGINITADSYPYTYWHSTIRVLFPKTDYTNMQSAQYAVDHTFDATKSVMTRFAPNLQYQGKTISEIAALRNESPAQTLISLIAIVDTYEKAHPEEGYVEGIVASSMSDDDVATLLQWPNTNICSDGSNGGHPRGYGTFTRVLGYYVREKKIMRLEEAIQKMTSLSAEHVGLQNRGTIAPGYFADLVLFNPGTVVDKATITDSKALSEGILKVWVNGKLVYADKKVTGVRSGEFLGR